MEEKYGLISQINRAAISVPSNVAEGCSRDSKKEFVYFIQIALGSCFELETQLLILTKLGFTKIETLNVAMELVEEEEKMLMAFIKTLRKNS